MNAAKTNHISLSFDAISENEAFARMTAAMFMAQLNPTLDDVEDVKTAVSEAVTNAIIHGYEMGDDNISSGQADHQAAEEKKLSTGTYELQLYRQGALHRNIR